MAGVAPIHKY